MFKELFYSRLYNDPFIIAFLKDTKSILKNREIIEALILLEEGNEIKCKEMSEFSLYLNDQIENLLNISEINDEYSDNDYFSKNIELSKKDKFEDIDDWVNYIITDENKPNKSKKKRNKPIKQKAAMENNKENNIKQNEATTKEDLEFETFKSQILQDSIKSCYVNKIQPWFTHI
jgi:hypothetical protein